MGNQNYKNTKNDYNFSKKITFKIKENNREKEFSPIFQYFLSIFFQ